MIQRSRLDKIYRRMLITRFFEKGWGKPDNLQRLVLHCAVCVCGKGHFVRTIYFDKMMPQFYRGLLYRDDCRHHICSNTPTTRNRNR